MHPRAAGFSLVEMMIAVSLAAVLMAIGVPMYRETIARSRLSEQTNELVGALTIARSEAITTNQTVAFCRADSAAPTVCAGSGDATTTWTNWVIVNAAGTVVRQGELPQYNSTFTVNSNLTATRVNFGSDGLARTNSTLVNNHWMCVRSSYASTNNRRVITLGAGSRVSTAIASGVCPTS
jgi:type IV fimbrial biogenesis protein FimT